MGNNISLDMKLISSDVKLYFFQLLYMLKKAVTDSASGSDSPAMPDMAVREEKIQLAVEMLTCKACSEEGSEDVTVLLLNFSYSGPQTR